MNTTEEDFEQLKNTEESPASLWKRIDTKREFMDSSYPQWMRDIVYTTATEASVMGHQDCYNRLVQWHKTQEVVAHPFKRVQHWLDTKDVTIMGPRVMVDDQERKVNMTMVVKNPTELKAAVVANVVPYTTASTSAGVAPKEFPKAMDMPKVNFVNLRVKILKCPADKDNSTDTQAYIYAGLKDRENIADLSMNAIGTLPNFKESPAISKKYSRPMKSMCSIKPTYPKARDLKNLYKYKIASEGARGTASGNGNLSVSYTTIAMTRREQHISSRIRDITNFMNYHGFTVMAINGELDMEVINSLKANFLIQHQASMNLKAHSTQRTGEFLSLKVKPDVTWMIADTKCMEPTVNKDGVSFSIPAEKLMINKLKMLHPAVAFFPLTATVMKETNQFPTGACDDCYVLATTVKNNVTISIDHWCVRMSTAISCRNYYPLYYVPFCTVDPFQNLYDWHSPIKLLKREVIAKKKKFSADVETDGHIEIGDEIDIVVDEPQPEKNYELDFYIENAGILMPKDQLLEILQSISLCREVQIPSLNFNLKDVRARLRDLVAFLKIQPQFAKNLVNHLAAKHRQFYENIPLDDLSVDKTVKLVEVQTTQVKLPEVEKNVVVSNVPVVPAPKSSVPFTISTDINEIDFIDESIFDDVNL